MIQLKTSRRGLTLREWLAVAVIVALGVALALPAIVAARAQSRRRVCETRIAGILAAAQQFENDTQAYPIGVRNPGPVVHQPIGLDQNWLSQLLPYADERLLFDQIRPDESVYAEVHRSVRETDLPAWKCPAAPLSPGASHFAGCHHDVEAPIAESNHGVFRLNQRVTVNDVQDGLTHTLFVGEKTVPPDDLGWMSGTRATLRNTGHPPRASAARLPEEQTGGFGSWHVDGAHFAHGDGRVTLITPQVDVEILRQLGHRSDGASLQEGPP